jgi:hypothetical protein
MSSSRWAMVRRPGGDDSIAPMSTLARTMTSIALLLLCSSPTFAQAARRKAADDPDMKELASYTLTMDGLNKVDAANKAMIAAIKKDPSLKPKDDDDSTGDAKTLTDMEKKINGMPVMAAALKQAGMSARDYAKFMMAMMQASFAEMAKQMSAKAGKPFQTPEGVNPANITFVEQHQADLKKLEESYNALNGDK